MQLLQKISIPIKHQNIFKLITKKTFNFFLRLLIKLKTPSWNQEQKYLLILLSYVINAQSKSIIYFVGMVFIFIKYSEKAYKLPIIPKYTIWQKIWVNLYCGGNTFTQVNLLLKVKWTHLIHVTVRKIIEILVMLPIILSTIER